MRQPPLLLPWVCASLCAGAAFCAALSGCSGPAPSETASQAGRLPDRETWEIYTSDGNRVGYGHTTISHQIRRNREVVRIEGTIHFAAQRFGQQTDQELRATCFEAPDGALIEFETEIQQGQTPMRTTGRVVGDRLDMEIATQGKKVKTSIPWSPEYQGLFAMEGSLLRQPMQPGEGRTIHGLLDNQVVAIELTARDFQPVKLPSGPAELLRIDTVTRFPNNLALRGAVWCDRAGDILKTWADVKNIESFRVTKEIALEQPEAGGLDLGTGVAVKLDRPLPAPHNTKRVVYRVDLEGGDPAAVFVAGPSQQVKSLGPHAAEVTVYALRPGQAGGNPDARDDPSTAGDLQANSLIQSDDAKIQAMAQQAAGDERDPWQVALKLERYVHQTIKKKDFSTAFATAAEVAQNPEGDCTEHAVLLAALVRARGIPARVAIGLVYLDEKDNPSFAYHMWDEVLIGKRWIPIDATLGRGGIGAAHLKLAQSNLEGAAAYSSFLPVIQVIGRLKIAVEKIE